MFSNGVLDTLILVSTVSISSNVIFKDFIQLGNYGTFLDEWPAKTINIQTITMNLLYKQTKIITS